MAATTSQREAHYSRIDSSFTPRTFKLCPACKQHKPVSSFSRHAKRKDGLQSLCRACSNRLGKARYERTKDRYRERNKKLRHRNQRAVYEYLKGKTCVDCGEGNPLVLTFDHVRGEKRGNVSDMSRQSWGLTAIFEEIAKCEVRCFNCHMLKDCKRWSAQTGQN